MATKSIRVVSWMYQKHIREKLKIIDTMLIGPTTKFSLSYKGSDPNAYTTLTGRDHDILRVVIGGGAVSNVAKLPDSFSSKKVLKPYIGYIKAAFYALNYHEMGHVLFTDMTLDAILSGLDVKYRGFGLRLFNIFEDPIIELAISKFMETEHPYDVSPRKFFAYMKKQIFDPQCSEYKDEGDVASFMQYLLLLFRCGKKAIPVSNAVYEKYSADLLPRIKGILGENDPVERQVKVVELAKWIIENIKEFNWDEVEAPEDMKPMSGGIPGSSPMSTPKGSASSVASGVSGKSEGADESEGTDEDDADDADEEGAGGSDSEEDGSDDDDDDEDESEGSESEDEAEDESEGSDTEFGSDDVEEDIDEVFDDLINSALAHEFVDAKDSFLVRDSSLLEDIDEQINKNKDCIDNITKFLTLFKGRKKPRRISGFTSGRLDVFRAMQDDIKNGCDTKLFQRNISRGKMVDLAVSLVCDNSGSMSGTSSTLASIAALALAQACDWAKIPFECSCFTKTCDSYSGTSITIIEKEFDDPFEKVKPFFGINDSCLLGKLTNLDHVPCFAGNSEEVNLFHIWKKLQKVKHDTKLMFVFCDGCTTGSRDALKKVIQQMEDDGIIVIGIGLCAPEVARVYPRHKIFENQNDIRDNLAPYLIETLSEFAI